MTALPRSFACASIHSMSFSSSADSSGAASSGAGAAGLVMGGILPDKSSIGQDRIPDPGKDSGYHRKNRAQPTSASTSSDTSKLAYTFWTSSQSSSASISLKTFFAPSASSGTLTDGRKVRSADS